MKRKIEQHNIPAKYTRGFNVNAEYLRYLEDKLYKITTRINKIDMKIVKKLRSKKPIDPYLHCLEDIRKILEEI